MTENGKNDATSEVKVEAVEKSETRESDARGSPPPAKAMPPKPQNLQLPPRPSSTTSTHSNSSNGAPRTTTSRRGGRTRSRSPPTMINRAGSGNAPPEREFADSIETRSQAQAQAPANPSAAAAAAAAAAKSLSNTSSRKPSQWYEGGPPEGGAPRDRRPEGAPYHPGAYDKRYPGSRSWPPEEDPESRRGYHSRSRDHETDPRYSQRGGPYPSDRSGSGSQSEGYHAAGRRQYEQYGGGGAYEDDGRHQDPRARGSFERERPRDRPSPHEGDRHHQRYGRRREHHDDYYRGPGGMAPVGGEGNTKSHSSFHDAFSPKASGSAEPAATPATVKRSGGTSRVIGTATPIHVPRAADPPGAGRHHAQGSTPASVFRGRPGDDLPSRQGDFQEDSPQKLLLSLRTPTTSFEELPKNRKPGREGQAPPLSPEEPPQIQHSHHQSQMDQALFFDQPNRGSPKAGAAVAQSGSLEMAPSFSLFNQSFDSLGDTAQYLNVTGPLEGAFNSASFGVAPSASRDIENPTQLLPNPSQAGSFAAGDRLFGSSSGGALTFGMSPVNSFGNGPPANSSRRSGSMMVLGGADQQPTSPTQMLSMYPSYSGGYGSQGSGPGGPPGGSGGGPPGGGGGAPFRTRSTEQNPMRSMSSGSFGNSGMYSRSYEASPHGSYPPRPQDGPPPFYGFLGRNKAAFVKCSFLLPGLKAALLESPLSDSKKEEEKSRKLTLGGRRGRFQEPSPHDSALALRRVASAICAFGGSITGDRKRASSTEKNKENKQSIFREKDDGIKSDAATVTPTSSSGTPPGSRGQLSRAKHKYDDVLPSRYYENENRLSWEFEESPPVGNEEEDDEENSNRGDESEGKKENPRVKSEEDGDEARQLSSSPTAGQKPSPSPTNEGGKKAASPQGDQPKMRYRCKLCGLPKQNHTCAYQQSLQRSIGVMIYPAVNAFTSSEPGMLAPTLTDMNNFVNDPSSTETSPSRPTPDRSRRNGHNDSPGHGAPNVTPETMRSSTSSSSGNSVGQRTPLRTPGSAKRKPRGSNMSGGAAMGQRVGTGSPPSSNRKRTHAQMNQPVEEDLLFVETIDLKPEQFRIVTPSKKAPGPDAYTYPSLPLPYAQRKRLSDNLFALSKEVPQLTDECAVVLREAREKDMWDLAVSELMTQVVVVIHCHDNDCRFEGLRHYLLTLGIAC